MTSPGDLSDKELFDLARQWRREALRGNKNARGHAHLYEVEYRRRVSAVPSSHAQLDLTPLQLRPSQPWWRFW